MLKILFAAHDPSFGGAQNVLYMLAAALKDERIAPMVLFSQEGPGIERFKAAGVATRVLPMSVAPHTCGSWGTAKARAAAAPFLANMKGHVRGIAELIEQEGIDIVSSNTAVIIEPALAACLAKRPHLWHIHEMLSDDSEFWPWFGAAFLRTLIGLLSSRVVGVSEAVRSRLSGFVPAESLEVVHNGIDVSAFECGGPSPRQAGEPQRLLFVGDFVERKRVHDLAAAASRVFETREDVHLYLAGREVEFTFEEVLSCIPQAHHPRAHYLGFRSDVPALLRAADALVLPSGEDPFPVAVLEAMATAVPVVGTRSGGMEEQIVDGETGRLVDVGRPDQLAEAILDVLSDPERARAMGEAGRRRVEANFTLARMVGRFRRIFLEMQAEPREVSQDTQALVRGILDVCERTGSRMVVEIRRLSEEKLRFETSYNYFMSNPAVRAYRAAKAGLRSIFGPRQANRDEKDV